MNHSLDPSWHEEPLKSLLPLLKQIEPPPIPGSDHVKPAFDAKMPIHRLAAALGSLAAWRHLFRQDRHVLTVEEATGEQRPMRAARFVTWIAGSATLTSGNLPHEVSLTREQAGLILESDAFQASLRPLRGTQRMRLPVLREDGRCELLAAGYDAPSQVFTAPALDYATDWTLDQAREHLDGLLGEYPWSGGGSLHANRSAAVQVAAILGTYCHLFFAPGSPRPMIAYLANQVGTGKSTLAAMALAHVHGEVPTTKLPKDDLAMDKELETLAGTRQPFVVFDDVGHSLASAPLNRFITSGAHRGRVMGGNQEMFTASALTQVFTTGNDLRLSVDLMRRTLVVELFYPADVRRRRFNQVITPASLAEPRARRQTLSACHALVQRWVQDGCPRHPAPLGSFEAWSGIVAAMVQCAGYADPLAVPELSGGGDQEGAEFREFFSRLAGQQRGDAVFTRQALVNQARRWGLLEELVGCLGDRPLNSSQNIRLGHQLKKWRCHEFTDEHGRSFRFEHGRKKAGVTYHVCFARQPAPSTAFPSGSRNPVPKGFEGDESPP